MNKNITKVAIIIGAWLAVLYPLYMRLKDIQWSWDSSLYLSLFPLFGLTAFSLLWLHSISGVFEPWLRKQFDFDRFVRITASLILICIIAHPLLLIMSPIVTFNDLLLRGGLYIWLGIIGWLLLIIYDLSKPFKKKNDFFVRHWRKVLVISNIGFLTIFFHSLQLGSDLQLAPLKYIWIFYGITAIISIVYTYGIKKPTT